METPREQNIVVDCLTELFLLPEVHLQFYIFLILKTTQLHRLSVSLFLVIGGFTRLMSSIIQRNLPQIGESDWLSHSRLFPLSINRAALQKSCWRTEGINLILSKGIKRRDGLKIADSHHRSVYLYIRAIEKKINKQTKNWKQTNVYERTSE